MDLYILRHAHAVEGSGSDFERTLSDKGRKQAEKMGKWLERIIPGPLRFVSSPYPRALETATIVAGFLRGSTVLQDARLGSGMRPDTASAIIHEAGGAGGLVLVGHSPDLDRLAANLVGCPEGGIAIRKGAIAAFDSRRAGAGGSVLQWLIDPDL